MFERFLTEALTNHFGHLIANLDADNIRVSAWNGELVLKDLKLRPDALERILGGDAKKKSCPFEICYGHVGHLELRIPWKLVRSKMWRSPRSTSPQKARQQEGAKCTVVLTDVNILVIPRRERSTAAAESTESNDQPINSSGGEEDKKVFQEDIAIPVADKESESAVEMERQWAEKEKQVQSRLDAELLRRVTESSRSPSLSSSRSWQWIQDRLAGILSNLSVTVRNIHVRYEDPGTSMGFVWRIPASSFSSNENTERKTMAQLGPRRYRPPMAIGVTLEEFSIQALKAAQPQTDSTEPSTTRLNIDLSDTKESAHASIFRRKTAAAQRVAIYWDSDCRIISALEGTEGYNAPECNSGDHETCFYMAAFKTLNEFTVSAPHGRQRGESRSQFSNRHSYILDPFSPSIEFAVVDQTQFDETPRNGFLRSSDTTISPVVPLAPNTMRAVLPPCHITFARTHLEDLGYLRKSWSIWIEMQRSSLSETTILRLTRLRPQQSALQDPRGWWKYSYEAVRALRSNHSEGVTSRRRHRCNIWLRAARAAVHRRRYADLYIALLSQVAASERLRLHSSLLEMERELSVEELVAFRIYAWTRYEKGKPMFELSDSMKEAAKDDEVDGFVNKESAEACLSLEHRYSMFQEMSRALRRVEANQALDSTASESKLDMPSGMGETTAVMSWTTSLDCAELSLQVNDGCAHRSRNRLRPVPVVRLSSSFSQKQNLFRDGSWYVCTKVGRLRIRDCTSFQDEKMYVRQFPYLVGPRHGNQDGADCLEVRLNRNMRWVDGVQRGYSTVCKIRVEPLDVVYSTSPVEALSRILNTANFELSDDYYRVGSRLHQWRDRQKHRLLAALAHKEKTIHIDVNIAAPRILLPERNRQKSRLLIVDLGKLLFFNTAASSQEASEWSLNLRSIQVQGSYVNSFRSLAEANSQSSSTQQIVEPFSLNFSISTEFGSEPDGLLQRSSVSVHATLPRLVFNLSSSAVHLFIKLQQQWKDRKLELQRQPVLPSIVGGLRNEFHALENSTMQDRSHESNRVLEFSFVAPLLRLRFLNDTDVSCARAKRPIQLVDLALRGIEGRIQSKVTVNAEPTLRWTAKMQSLDTTDLFQTAGAQFSFLLSSFPPDIRFTRGGKSESTLSAADLVSFEYRSQVRLDHSNSSECPRDSLSVVFNELYIEWNPETLAEIQRSIKVSGEREDEITEESCSSQEDAFFDAEEDDFFDADASVSESESSYVISEIASSRQSSFSEPLNYELERSQFVSPLRTAMPRFLESSFGDWASAWSSKMERSSDCFHLKKKKLFEVRFSLSKLRVSFNKEVRHRRVFIAEMDGTECRFVTRESGGSVTQVTIGNLIFTDPSSADNSTLYREILGLKTDVSSPVHGPSSLLELELAFNPRSRQYVLDDLNLSLEKSYRGPVIIDSSKGLQRGCDLAVRARLSPMRFVYLQQLWFEIIDYFFEGIVGYEVWGSTRPLPVSALAVEPVIQTADVMSFTSLNVELLSPVVLIPVTYCSTDYLRFDFDAIRIANRYSFSHMRHNITGVEATDSHSQWFNNCTIRMENLKLQSWSGADLSNLHESAKASVEIVVNWPVGPTAPLNTPKWKVDCNLDSEICLSLGKDDFSVLQNLLSYNVGEQSRHLDEWEALQRTPRLALTGFNRSVLVHFAYDKKDGTPTTFEVEINTPGIKMIISDDTSREIATVRASSICWSYRKMPDSITRQRMSCSLTIFGMVAGYETPMLSARLHKAEPEEELASLIYSSTSFPGGNNEKVLQIAKPCIFLRYREWREFGAFFQGLKTPTFLSPDQGIQVGDRWYKIGEQSPFSPVTRAHPHVFQWAPRSEVELEVEREPSPSPVFSFRFLLESPSLAIGSTESLVLAMRSIDFSHLGEEGKIKRELCFDEIELTTSNSKTASLGGYSLIRPWRINASSVGCNGKEICNCNTHEFIITADVLRAEAAFSEMLTASDVCLRLQQDIVNYSVPQSHASSLGVQELKSEGQLRGLPREGGITWEVEWKGLTLVVVDDTGRHFANTQELVSLSLSHLTWCRCDRKALERYCKVEDIVRLGGLDLVDCLQSTDSPFRSLARLCAPTRGQQLSDKSSTSMKVVSGLSDGEQRRADLMFDDVEDSSLPALELKCVQLGKSREYSVAVDSVLVQYNPSIIIALQRFLGRFTKEVSARTGMVIDEAYSESDAIETATESGKDQWDSLQASINFRNLSVTLNKEHQGRSLARFVVQTGRLDIKETSQGTEMSGRVSKLTVADVDESSLNRDSICEENRRFLRTCHNRDFIVFRFRTFSSRQLLETTGKSEIPGWVQSQLDRDTHIDDFLEVEVASIEIVYLSERSEELLDYVTNGLPGKGMGFTTRAAKGFVEKRIAKRSFFQLQVESPIIAIPKSPREREGVQFGGDLRLQSWVESDRSVRRSSLSIEDFSLLSYDERRLEENIQIFSPFDLTAHVERSPNSINVLVDMSSVSVRLSYTDFSLIALVLRLNINRRPDKKRWDNLEVAWEKEVVDDRSRHFSREVAYSTHARRVRYGVVRGSSSTMGQQSRVKVRLAVGSLACILHRNDFFNGESTNFSYDLAVMTLIGLEIATTSCGDDHHTSASIKSFDLRDLGDAGRRAREVMEGTIRAPSLHSTIVKGYHSANVKEESATQIVVSIDKKKHDANSTGDCSMETIVSIVVNFLSITALSRPLRELGEFFGCAWPLSGGVNTASLLGQDRVCQEEDDHQPPSRGSLDLSARLVLYYPRVVFISDESVTSSKALVLSGLAIVNGIVKKKSTTSEVNPENSLKEDLKVINADLQNLSSHIYASVKDAFDGHTLVASGVPLILPLTLGVDVEEIRSRDTIKRNYGVSVEKVAVVVGAEDLNFVLGLWREWPERQVSLLDDIPGHCYSVYFHEELLGLGLRKDSGQIIVESAGDSRVSIGDSLFAVNDRILTDSDKRSLSNVVCRLRAEPRPLKMSFVGQNEVKSGEPCIDGSICGVTETAVNVSISVATFTLIDIKTPLFRGELSSMRNQFGRLRESGLVQDSLLVSFALGLDFFNTRNREWEPVLEPCLLSASLEVADTRGTSSSKEMTIEFGDKVTGPILVNVSDASVAIFQRAVKRLFVGRYNGGQDEVRDEGYFTKAAFDFALRQKSGTDGCSLEDGANRCPTDQLEEVFPNTLTMRNLLPVPIGWSINVLKSGDSTIRNGELGEDNTLASGENVVIETMDGNVAEVRFRYFNWSPWYRLSLSKYSTPETSPVLIKTLLGPPIVFHLRTVSNAANCLELTVYAELWLLNTTSLNISFGASREQLIGSSSKNEENSSKPESTASTAAEAALKEISSLFEGGDDGIEAHSYSETSLDIMPMSSQFGSSLTEETFEYIEVHESLVVRQWWAGEEAESLRYDITSKTGDGEDWQWIDDTWIVDKSGKSVQGWETSPNLFGFCRTFNPAHRFRRRRWLRQRRTAQQFVNAFHQPRTLLDSYSDTQNRNEMSKIKVAFRADGGQWSLSSSIPRDGTVYGAVRVPSTRWPHISNSDTTSTYELCYTVSPLDGPWGVVSRVLVVTSRFLVRNLSKRLTFQIKQSGVSDSKAAVLCIGPGETHPFHWASLHLPELISIRPAAKDETLSTYRWSGGFDPVTIGAVPIRVRLKDGCREEQHVSSIQLEVEIRPKSGGTGINLSLTEEDVEAGRSLFRIENHSPFPIWLSQDGIIAQGGNNDETKEGDLLRPSDLMSFALDVPFRQGKYHNSRAVTMDELFRVRLGLAPLSTRDGIETTKVVPFTIYGAAVRLNPSKLLSLTSSLRNAMQQARVLGFVSNDGPTRVLRFMLIQVPRNVFANPFGDDMPSPVSKLVQTSTSRFAREILGGAMEADLLLKENKSPTEAEAAAASSVFESDSETRPSGNDNLSNFTPRLATVSFRLSFSGFVVSLIDSAPTEIAVATFKNLNALATWNTQRTTDSTIYVTVEDFQVDNMIPNAPYPIAIGRDEWKQEAKSSITKPKTPLLVIGLSFAPRHKSEIICLKSVTIAPHNIAVQVDLAFLVRLQKYALDLKAHFQHQKQSTDTKFDLPDLAKLVQEAELTSMGGGGRQKFYFGGLTILPCNIRFSVAPARALTSAQAAVEGEEAAAIHQAVRKGDVRLGNSDGLLGVKIGSRNATPLAVVRGVFKSIVVDALLRLDGASLNLAGVCLRNHVSTSSQLSTHLGAHYLASLRQNVPALLASMAAFGNPLGLARSLGDGVSDFVLEPVKGFQRSVQEMDATYLMDGVARGTVSLARHTFSGIADSAASITETFSKNMTVLTLDRRYAQKRDRGENLRHQTDINVALGLGSGVQKLALGFVEGVTGVVQAPMRGAEKRGFEGFAKGIGKGLLGLLVKPVIGLSDGITDVMIGVKGSMEGAGGPHNVPLQLQIRPRRAFVGSKRVMKSYSPADAAAQALMERTRLAGEFYFGHVDLGDRVALLSVRQLLLLGPSGEEMLLLKFKHIASLEFRQIRSAQGDEGWGIIVMLNTPRRNLADVEVITCREEGPAVELRKLIEQAMAQGAFLPAIKKSS